jgi:hypothetical protein
MPSQKFGSAMPTDDVVVITVSVNCPERVADQMPSGTPTMIDIRTAPNTMMNVLGAR